MKQIQCEKGQPCGNACIEVKDKCQETISDSTITAGLDKWAKLAEGNYGVIYQGSAPENTGRVKKVLKEGREWGPHEVELSKKMGELGHSPKVFSATPDAIEMEKVNGKPIWSGYARNKEADPPEPEAFTDEQAFSALNALYDLHKMGYGHGDQHSQQWVEQPDGKLKLLDYGLSFKAEDNPEKVFHDISKSSAFIKPERFIDNEPGTYTGDTARAVAQYREIKGASKAAKEQKSKISQDYLNGLSKYKKFS